MASQFFTRRLGAAATICAFVLAATSLPAQAAASGSSGAAGGGAGSAGPQSTSPQSDTSGAAGATSGTNRMGTTNTMGSQKMKPKMGAQNVSPPGPDSSTGTSPSAGPHVPGDQNSSDSVGQ